MMLSEEDIVGFCKMFDYDLRKSHNGRWIDQKCTPDVVWSVSDFVLNYVDNVGTHFSPKDIWKSEYAKETIAETFSKPGTDNSNAENEYDKVFSQPLNMLCYAGVLKDVGKSNRHSYVVDNRAVLDYIAVNDICAFRFLCIYIEKVLNDSGIYWLFKSFFTKQDKPSFNTLKEAFVGFCHEHTSIKGELEPKRIFPKVLNPLSCQNQKLGSKKGYLSKTHITRSDLMYNKDNFRDVYRNKPKNVTRKEWLAQNKDIDIRKGYFEQQWSRSKRLLVSFNEEYRNNQSELTMFVDGHNDSETVTQLHHIFPKSDFPEIMHYLENVIALTPNQHFAFAHPGNDTRRIDEGAQKILLIAKTRSIEQNINSNEETIFEFAKLLYVLSIGWEDEDVKSISEGDYAEVIHEINVHY